MSILFDSADDSVIIPDFADVGNSDKEISVFVWINAVASASRQVPYSHWDSVGDDRGWILLSDSVSPYEKGSFLITTGGESTNRKFYTSSVGIFNSIWNHVGFTFNNGTYKIYINGAEDTSVTKVEDDAITTVHNSTADILISGENAGPSISNIVNGQMTDFVIYPGVLTDAEILRLYQSKMKLGPLQLGHSALRYYPMDDGPDGTSADGDTVRDLSGNGNDGTGDDGANDTGLTWKAEAVLSYPADIIQVV